MEQSREVAIANAKLVLKQAGYFVDNLWSTQDVRELYPDASDEFCHRILNEALTDPYVMEVVWYKLEHIQP